VAAALLNDPTVTTQQAPFAGEPPSETELRLVTVLFADIQGFTTRAEQLSPEAAAELMNRCFEAVVPAITRFGGTVDKYTGDGLMARFGAPVTHEDDPERAIHAALGMQRALADLRVELRMRIGINTGPVVAGPVGAQVHREYTLMGDAVNVAARLEQECPLGGVLVGETTHRLASRAFHFDAPRPLLVRGKSMPVEAYLVLSDVAEPPDRLASPTRPLVGRDLELTALCDAARQAAAGNGQVVLVLGEPGVGKSRLWTELRHRLGSGTAFAVARCQSYRQSTPDATLAQLVRSVAGLSAVAETDLTTDRLDAWLTSLLGQLPGEAEWRAEVRAALLDVLGLPSDGGLPEPRVRRARLARAFLQIMAAQAHATPLVLVVDDLQWIDESSLDVLDELVGALPSLPILLVALARPERLPPWNVHSSFRQLTLGPLREDHGRELLSTLLVDSNVPPALADRLLERTGGNPFFLEEIVASLREAGALRAVDGRWTLHEERSDLPATVQEVLQARIDRLGRVERSILQVAAVVGRTFDEGLLRVVSRVDGGFDDALRLLRRHELIYEQAVLPTTVYTFKHAITQEVVYASLPRARRRELHARVAARLASESGALAGPPHALLAHHYLQAEAWQPARVSLLEAAHDAKERFANDEALALYDRALTILERAAAGDVAGLTPADARLATIDLLSERHGVFGVLARNVEERADLERMHALAAEIGDDRRQSDALNGLADFLIRHGDLAAARAAAEAALPIKARLGDRAGEADTLSNLAPLYSSLGDFAAAKAANRRALDLRQAIGDERGQIRSLDNLGVNHLFTGDLLEGHDYIEQALTRARTIGYRGYELQATIHLAGVLALMGDGVEARAAAEDAQALARAIGSRPGEAWALDMVGNAELCLGRADEAERALAGALEMARATSSSELEVRALYRLGDALTLLERPVEALDAFEEAVRGAQLRGFWVAQVEGSAGAALAALESGQLERAREHAEQAVALLARLGPEGIHEGQILAWRLGRVFQALGDPRGPTFQQRARAIVRQRAATLPTPERRQTYLSRPLVRVVLEDPVPPEEMDAAGSA